MCIAIAKPIGTKIPKETYRNCFSNNDDGAGFAYIREGQLYVAKGFFSFQDFWDNFEELEEQAGLIHFRVGTSGGVTGENCHPWRVSDTTKGDPIDLAFIHNGVISINRPNQNLSDTGNFNDLILKELVKTDPDFWKQKEFKWMIESAIGSGNKLVMMDHTGHFEIFNEGAGKWEGDVWFSNTSYGYCKNSHYSSRSNYQTHWQEQLESESESVAHESVVDRADSVTEGDFAGIDTDSIDARLEQAEEKRLAGLRINNFQKMSIKAISLQRRQIRGLSPQIIGNCVGCNAQIFDSQKNNNHRPYCLTKIVKLPRGWDFVCSNCFDKYESCQFCGGMCEGDNLFMGACPNCVTQSPRHCIKNYTFRVDQEIPMLGNAKDQLFYGVELELETVDYGRDTMIVADMVKKFARLKRDASLEQGFEIVTAPASLDKHYEVWEPFFANLPKTVYPLRTCGMHVHVSRFRLSDLQIGKLLCFLHNPDNYKFVKMLAGRPSNYHNNYTNPKKISDGANGGILPQNSDRHTALNLNGDKTIEFRIFKSTTNATELFKNIEACRALVKFTDWGTCSIQEAKNWRYFIEFVNSNKREYPNLVKFLKANLHRV